MRLFTWLTGDSTDTSDTYSYKAILSFSCDPSNIVHDFHGTIDVEGRATRDKVLDQVIAEYVEANRHLRRADVQVLSFDLQLAAMSTPIGSTVPQVP